MPAESENVVAVVQARMGSSRLPGKAMISLACTPIIRHVVRRTKSAGTVDEVVVATAESPPNDIIDHHARRGDASVVRGDEEDVLGRVYAASIEAEADVVVRVTADNPLLSPEALDVAVEKLLHEGVDYVSNKLDRTFPAGLDVEVFTIESFERIDAACEDSYYREHVTPYYRESDSFSTLNLDSGEVFNDESYQDRTNLRLTLDTPTDFELFERIYENVEFDEVLDIRDAIRYVDEAGIGSLNVE